MALVIQNGVKGEMPSFAKKYNQQETDFIVAYSSRRYGDQGSG
jgi:hypothetical protein